MGNSRQNAAMGKRGNDKPKKKSIKANVTSKMNSTRRLSRMGKKVNAGQAGPSTEYVTRSYALKKLQISLKDFRRLCILKGIYPRVPTKAPKGSDKVYYDIKDLTHLAHEPLLNQFREFKTFMRKIRKAAGRNQHADARRKDDLKPQIVLDHLVKERYPRFIDALRDLDDTLSMIHLFAALPSQGRITPEKTNRCKELVRHWQYYIARSKSLTKVFVSVKGVYFQSEIMGEPITWLQPHAFTQTIPSNIDFRVMITFLDFYEVFLKFVMFKLFGTLELSYPPVIDRQLDASGCFLLAVKGGTGVSTTEDQAKEKVSEETSAAVVVTAADAVTAKNTKAKAGKGLKMTKVSKMESKIAAINKDTEDLENIISEFKEDEDEDQEDEVDITQPLSDVFAELHGQDYNSKNPLDLNQADQATFNPASMTTDQEGTEKAQNSRRTLKEEQSKLFQNLCFFVNRETPLEWLQLCVISFGGNIGWDGPDSPYQFDDARITHQVVDRPTQGTHGSNQREYIQPQWVFDSINAMVCLPIHKYRPGAVLPPHLSPFVDDAQEGYIPQYRKEVAKLVSTVAVQKGLTDAAGEKLVANQEEESGAEDESEEESDEEGEGEYERDLQAERKGVSYSAKRSRQEQADSEEEEEGSEEEDDDSKDEDEDEDEDESEDDDDEGEGALNSKKQKGVVYAHKKGSEGEVSTQHLCKHIHTHIHTHTSLAQKGIAALPPATAMWGLVNIWAEIDT